MTHSETDSSRPTYSPPSARRTYLSSRQSHSQLSTPLLPVEPESNSKAAGQDSNLSESDLQHECLIQIFRRYLSQDQVVFNTITQFKKSFRLDNETWQFTLRDLHRFCQTHIHGINTLNYQQFKQLLYQNPTNQDLSEHRGKLETFSNSGHIDKSIYCLSQSNKS